MRWPNFEGVPWLEIEIMKLYQQLDVFLLHFANKMAIYMEYYVQITIYIRRNHLRVSLITKLSFHRYFNSVRVLMTYMYYQICLYIWRTKKPGGAIIRPGAVIGTNTVYAFSKYVDNFFLKSILYFLPLLFKMLG